MDSLDNILSTTNIVGHRALADEINWTICNALPLEDDNFILSEAIDFENGHQIASEYTQSEFKSKTNLPLTVRLQQGARVMFLNNSLMAEGICNGTIGIVTNVDKNKMSVQVAFCINAAIVHRWITQQTAYFYASGQSSRTQFPLQNCFALTVHKTQSLTLPQISVDLSQLFSPGQAYTAVSRCKTWDNIQIIGLHREAFIVDPEVVKEYERLEHIATQSINNFPNI
jgi:ATP-dependent exoDNAse (exonuclease V) alpha subunit